MKNGLTSGTNEDGAHIVAGEENDEKYRDFYKAFTVETIGK